MTDLATAPLDLLVRNVRLVRPGRPGIRRVDIGIRDGRFAQIAADIPVAHARVTYNGRDRLAFPGVVDAHTGTPTPVSTRLLPTMRSPRAAPP